MRPLKLTMQAFGPYAGAEEIDFTKLDNRTMFVISGKTGSGKTTIFDGISYAIYGKASGEDRNGQDLRSQFAKDDILTEVSLLFTLRNKTYHIIRSPQQEKRKERGEGYRTINATAELYVIDHKGNSQLIAANVRDVDEKIKEIMIIDSNQFRQILMIPQGEFRKLLTSESKEKEVILQRLFHTQIYKRIEEKLKESASELKKSVEKQVENRNHELRQIHSIYNDELKGFLESGSENDILIMPLLLDEVSTMTHELEGLAHKLKEKKEERDGLQQKLYDAEAIVKQMKARDDLAKRNKELAGEQERFIQIEKEIKLAHKAALLAHQEEICHHLKKELDGTNLELVALRTKVGSLEVLLNELEVSLNQEKNREDERRAVAEEISRLQNMKSDVYSLADVQQEFDQLEKTINMNKLKKRELEEKLNTLDSRVKELVEEKKIIEQAQLSFVENAHKLEKMNEEIERINKYVDYNTRLEKASCFFEKKKQNLEKETARLADAKVLVDHLEQKWIHGQASLIASQLQDGESCPVCGSKDHPQPAFTSETIPDENDLKAAKHQLVQLEKEKASAESAFFEAQSMLRSLKETVDDLLLELQKHRPELMVKNLPIIGSKIKSECSELASLQSVLKKKVDRRNRCMKELEEAEDLKEQNNLLLQKLIEQMNDSVIEFTEKKTNLTRMFDSVPEGLRSISSYEKRLQQVMALQEELLQRLENAQKVYQTTKDEFLAEKAKSETVEKQAEHLTEKLKLERAAFLIKMKEQGFETYSLYHDAKKNEQQVREMETALKNYYEEVRSVRDRYEELCTVLKDIEKPELEKLEESLTEIDNLMNSLQDDYTNLYMKKRDNEEITNKVNSINEQLKSLEERYKVIGELFDISRGQNTYRITFERFVLAAFLDDILQEANGRLRKMTNGRFEMIRKTDRSKGNIQSGLELLVFDQYTGKERHVKTLSGGESFKAALALALGLADVVQAYAGGVSLETMFIDEGFGTLDPESLDQAIEALIDIQSSGRLVGIISHVPELKERIDARLEVTATQSGSKTEFHFLT